MKSTYKIFLAKGYEYKGQQRLTMADVETVEKEMQRLDLIEMLFDTRSKNYNKAKEIGQNWISNEGKQFANLSCIEDWRH